MTSIDARRFTEPSEFAAAIRGAEVDLTVFGHWPFDARILAMELPGLRVQRFSETAPRIMHLTNVRATEFIFHTRPGPGFVQDGIEVTSQSMVRRGRSKSHFQRSSGPVRWGGLSLSDNNVNSLEVTIAECDHARSPNEAVITPVPHAMETFQRLHAAAGLIAQEAPEVIENPESARGLEQILMQALARCLETTEIQQPTSTQIRHHEIMERFQAMLKAEPDRPVYVLEMAMTVGASLRSLSVCCQEHLGMGPKRYLLLRRMHLARQALCAADPAVTTVTDVATQHGFWQFGRFAAEYKHLFGELPSVTLRKARAV